VNEPIICLHLAQVNWMSQSYVCIWPKSTEWANHMSTRGLAQLNEPIICWHVGWLSWTSQSHINTSKNHYSHLPRAQLNPQGFVQCPSSVVKICQANFTHPSVTLPDNWWSFIGVSFFLWNRRFTSHDILYLVFVMQRWVDYQANWRETDRWHTNCPIYEIPKQ